MTISNGWDSGVKLLSNPNKLGQNSPDLYIPIEIEYKIDRLSQEMGSTEWGGYLIGSDNVVNDLIIPDQKVSGATWEFTGEETYENVIGTIHSHHNMKASPSRTDTDYVGFNYKFMCIFSFQDRIKAWTKLDVKEGVYMLLPTNVIITGKEVDEDWLLQSLKKIELITTTKKHYNYRPKKTTPTSPNSSQSIQVSNRSEHRTKHCTVCDKVIGRTEHYENFGLCDECLNEPYKQAIHG